MAEIRNTYLIFVDIKDEVQSNKFYDMIPSGDTFKVKYGRVGSSSTSKTYPIAKWQSIYKNKTRKGYKDITDLKVKDTVVIEDSGNTVFNDFYDVFSKYAKLSVRSNYISEGCTKAQLEEAQFLLNKISDYKQIPKINEHLLELYKVIPRRMGDVRNFLIKDISQKDKIVLREQNALDGMDSANIVNVSNPYKDLNMNFEIADDKSIKLLEKLIYPTMGHRVVKIHKAYNVSNDSKQESFKQHVDSQTNKSTKFLIHGTRNPNIFSILKSGLMIRPTNAAVISGAAYGDGIYHSAHTAKSLGYTGNDNDKIFLIQNVHMGNEYTYEGWYRDGKDISRSQMNYNGLKKLGYDSLYVKPGDGLLNSEYIVYKEQQSVTNYLVWLK